MDLGTVAIVALIAGLAGGAVAAALVGTVEGMLRQRYAAPVIGQWIHRTGPPARPIAHEPPEMPPTARPAQPVDLHGAGPFDDFSDRAKRVLALSRNEAQRLGHDDIGTEHLLLALICDGAGAAKVLASLGVELDQARAAAEQVVGRGNVTDPIQITLSPAFKRALALAREEARKLGHTPIATDHMLIGLCLENGRGTEILRSLGLSGGRVHGEVIASLSRRPPSGGPLPI